MLLSVAGRGALPRYHVLCLVPDVCVFADTVIVMLARCHSFCCFCLSQCCVSLSRGYSNMYLTAFIPRGGWRPHATRVTAHAARASRLSADYLPTLAFIVSYHTAQNYLCQKHHGTLHPHDRLADTYTLSRHTTVLSVEKPHSTALTATAATQRAGRMCQP